MILFFSAAAVNRASTSNQPKTTHNKPNTSQGKPQNTMLAYVGKDLERYDRENLKKRCYIFVAYVGKNLER